MPRSRAVAALTTLFVALALLSWSRAPAASAAGSNYLFLYGPPGNANIVPVVGDWNGDGHDSPGWYNRDDGSWHLSNRLGGITASDYLFLNGPPGNLTIIPVAGDWNGDGRDSVGWYNPSDGSWHLTNKLGPITASDYLFVNGPAGDTTIRAVAGDWNGDGRDSVGWYRPSDASWHLSNSLAQVPRSDYAFVYGHAGDVNIGAVTGDWNADGRDSTGWYDPSDGSWHLSNQFVLGEITKSDAAFLNGLAGVTTIAPVAADWNGDRRGTVGWYRPDDGSWHLSDQLAVNSGAAFPPTQPSPVERLSRSSVIQAVNGSLEYAYVDNIGRLFQGHQRAPEIFGDVQWTSLSGTEAFSGQPALGSYQDGRVHLAADDARGHVRTRSRTSRDGPDWAPLVDQGGAMISHAVIGRQPDGTLAVFAVDTSGQLWLLPQAGVNGPFLEWRSLGAANLAGTPAVAELSTGLQLVGLDRTTGAVKTAAWRNNALTAWTSLGGSGFSGDPAVVVLPGPLLRVFVRGADGVIATKRQDITGAWPAAWTPVSGFTAAGSPGALLSPASGRVEVVARSADGHYFSTGETEQGSGVWRPWVQVVDQFGSPVTAATDPTTLAYTDSGGATWGFAVRTSDQESVFVTSRQPGGAAALAVQSERGLRAEPGDGPPIFSREVLPRPEP
jgi:hypothetical protein